VAKLVGRDHQLHADFLPLCACSDLILVLISKVLDVHGFFLVPRRGVKCLLAFSAQGRQVLFSDGALQLQQTYGLGRLHNAWERVYGLRESCPQTFVFGVTRTGHSRRNQRLFVRPLQPLCRATDLCRTMYLLAGRNAAKLHLGFEESVKFIGCGHMHSADALLQPERVVVL